MKAIKTVLSIFLISTLALACDSNPVQDEHDHADVEGLALVLNGVEIVTVENGIVSGKISVAANEVTTNIEVEWKDHDGDHFHEDDLDPVLSLGHQMNGTADVAEFEHHNDHTRFVFQIHGENAGTTSIELQLFNVDHVDFRTPPIPIEVN